MSRVSAWLNPGLLGLTLGGWAVQAIGAQRSVIGMMSLGVVGLVAMGLASSHWSNGMG